MCISPPRDSIVQGNLCRETGPSLFENFLHLGSEVTNQNKGMFLERWATTCDVHELSNLFRVH